MNYVDEVAQQIKLRLPNNVLPDDDAIDLFRIYAVLALGDSVITSRNIHDAWVAWMSARDPGHDALVPFEQLANDVAREDAIFARAVNEVRDLRKG